MNEPKFDANRYLASRPLYPRSIYTLLLKRLSKRNLRFLDLGCGTGQSTFSFASLGLSSEGVALDRDPAMIETARAHSKDRALEFRVGAAESLPLENESVDLVLIASAIHWFRIDEAKRELERVLKPGGFLFAYEYQFPKAFENEALNEWIRRKFNTEWKAPRQSPRGRLVDLLAPFASDANRWTPIEDGQPTWTGPLTLSEFLGNLFSQSRYLHAEALASDVTEYQQAITRQIQPFFERGPLLFDWKPRAYLTEFRGKL